MIYIAPGSVTHMKNRQTTTSIFVIDFKSRCSLFFALFVILVASSWIFRLDKALNKKMLHVIRHTRGSMLYSTRIKTDQTFVWNDLYWSVPYVHLTFTSMVMLVTFDVTYVSFLPINTSICDPRRCIITITVIPIISDSFLVQCTLVQSGYLIDRSLSTAMIDRSQQDVPTDEFDNQLWTLQLNKLSARMSVKV